MRNKRWPILMVVAANTLYNVCAKSTPRDVNGFASLAVTYAAAAVCAVLLFYLTGEQKNLAARLGKTNWTAWVLGLSIVGLEFGFLCVYRAGWKISTGNLVASITLSCVLLAVGILPQSGDSDPPEDFGNGGLRVGAVPDYQVNGENERRAPPLFCQIR